MVNAVEKVIAMNSPCTATLWDSMGSYTTICVYGICFITIGQTYMIKYAFYRQKLQKEVLRIRWTSIHNLICSRSSGSLTGYVANLHQVIRVQHLWYRICGPVARCTRRSIRVELLLVIRIPWHEHLLLRVFRCPWPRGPDARRWPPVLSNE